MKKVLIKLTSVMLMITIITTFVPFGAVKAEDETLYNYERDGSFVMKEDGEYYRYYGPTGELDTDFSDAAAVISSQNDYYNAHKNSKKDIAQTGTGTLPSSVDLSKSKYFPPVGDQKGLGSCATFSSVYYQFSYAVNEKNDIQATAENTRSPQIVYNFVNAGGGDGTYYGSNYTFLSHFGAPSMKTVPYTDQDDKNWYAYDGVWREGIRNRLKDYYVYDEIGLNETQITTSDDTDLAAVKTALADGKVLGYSTRIYSWVYSDIKQNANAPENASHAGEKCVTVCDGVNGSHAMTIVGYNDNLWIDVNNNNNVDSGEIGAFKIVNSWGDGYCNNGFAWVAYDALNETSVVENSPAPSTRHRIFEDIRSITVREKNDMSDIYFQYTLNTAKRTQHKVTFNVENNGDVKSWQMFYGSGGGYTSESNEGSFEGTTVASDGTFVCPIDLITTDFTYDDFESCNFSIEIEDTSADSNPLIIKDVRVVNDLTGKSYQVSQTLPVSVDGSKTSFEIKAPSVKNKVIYYIGFDNPTLHYKIGNSEFKEVKLNECYDRLGYNTKYVFEETEENITLYFTDENGNKDDNNGKYYTSDDRLNFYRTVWAKEKVQPTDIRVPEGFEDTGVRFFFETDVQGGYEPYNYQYTITNLDTGSEKVIEFEAKYEKSHVFYDAGNYRVKVEVKDQSGDIAEFTKDMLIENLPFEFEILNVNTEKHLVGNASSFTAKTRYESIISRGNQHSMYKFDVKDDSGEIVYSKSIRSTKYHLTYKRSTIEFSYIPSKAGAYTLTVSSTDGSKEYAEKTISFNVTDKIIGDTDASGDITIMDATNIQRYLVNLTEEPSIILELSEVDKSEPVSIMDATCIQRYLAHAGKSGYVGETIEYIPPIEPTEAPTKIPTEPVTQPVSKNTVTFTNSFNWNGTIYCYYWSDADTAMTSWPGVAMKNSGTNDFSQTLYTFDVPENATYLIFTNGSSQTTDITYKGGQIRYYPISSTDSQGHYLVETW